MKKELFCILFLLSLLNLYAQPGKDGTLTVTASTQIVNQYSPLSASITIGDNTLTVASTSVISLCQGDLIMVYQAQGAAINSTNSVLYGDITAYNSAGFYEFKYVQSAIGNVITTQTTFTNSYALSGRPQVIKVPQYTTLTINPGSSIIPKPWKDTTIATIAYRFGGLVVVHATNIVNNGTITANGKGFRGGQLDNNVLYPFGITDYVSNLSARGGEKGESISGYQIDYDLISGRYCRGAAANGGGGGNSVNSSGGGGANGFNGNAWTGQGVMIANVANPLAAWSLDPGYIANSNALTNSSGGGRGGYTWSNSNGNALVNAPGAAIWNGDLRREVGGLGGRPLTNIAADTRIYFGGGGGGPHQNNAAGTAGSNGGGIVYLMATGGISGTGNIESNGLAVPISIGCHCDGVGGGGAGGSIVIKTPAIVASQNVASNGGNGGSQLAPTGSPPFEAESGGGGGGGGFVAISAVGTVPTLNGGLNGTTLSSGLTEFPFNGTTQGATGQTGTVTASFVTYVVPSTTLISNSPICSGATLNFTNSAANTYTWSGPNSYSSFVQNPSIPNTTTLMAGTYTLSTTFTSGCVTVLTQTIDVIIDPTPTLSIANVSICPTTTGTLIATGASTYTWNPGGIVSNSVTAAPAVTSVFTATGTSTAGCTAIKTATMFVRPTLTLNITASSPTACVNNSITLTALNSGGTIPYTYTWTAGPLTAIYNTTRPAGTYIYTVTSKDFNNCFAVKTISVSFIALPVVSVSNMSVCAGSAGTLTASGATSYTWKPGNFAVNPFVTTPLVTSNYTVTGSAAGCTANATASIIVIPLPSLSFVTASITCASLGSATVSATGGALGPYSYSWTPTAQTTSIATNLNPGVYTLSVFDAGSGCTSVSTTTFTSLIPFTGTVSASNSLTCNGINTATAGIVVAGGSGTQSYLWSSSAGTQTSSTATNLGAGIHTVVVTDGVTFCTVTETFLVIQPAPLVVNVTSSAPMACVGSSIVLSATGSGGTPIALGAPYTFSWSGGPTNFLYTPTQAISGTYVYTVSAVDANGCSASANALSVFVDYPVLSLNNPTVCNGAIASLSVSGAQAYSWYPGGFTGNNINVSVSATSIYTVIGNSLGCTTMANATVFVNTPPIAGIVSSNTVCEGASINLSATGSGTYTWAGPNSFNSTNQTTVISSAVLNNAGTYSLTVTDNNGCSGSTSTLVTVLSNPVPSAIGASVCIGEPATLSAWGGLSYSWGGPNAYTANTQNAFIPIVDNNSSGTYTVFVTGNNSCSSSTIVQVAGYNYPLPSPSISATPKICLYSKINLQGSGGGTYLWTGPANFTSHDQSLDFSVGSLNMSGIYTLSVKNQSNCAASTTVLITVYALPNATLTSYRDKTCVPLCTDFSILQSNKNIAPIVKTNFVVQGLFASDTAFSYCIQKGGDHLISAFFTDTNGCVNSSTLNLTVYPQPLADFDYYPKKPIENLDQVIFTNTSSGQNLAKWNWFFNDNSGKTSELKNTSYVYEQAGAFPVAMIVTNTWGCSDTIVKSIMVEQDFSLFVPNAFTPNGDGRNDIFQPKGLGVVSYHLQIFDRWGEKLFSSDDFLKGWDGTFKGTLCKNDVYLWKIDITNSQSKTKNLSGHVSLME